MKNGPALASYGSITMKNALANAMSTLPIQLARSLTWDRGKEMSAHAKFTIETGIDPPLGARCQRSPLARHPPRWVKKPTARFEDSGWEQVYAGEM